jgi:hypothetical protein
MSIAKVLFINRIKPHDNSSMGGGLSATALHRLFSGLLFIHSWLEPVFHELQKRFEKIDREWEDRCSVLLS